jgi:hypothetical protein
MRVRFIDQPARDQLGEEIAGLLRSTDTQRFWAASAWVRCPGLRRLEAELAEFADRVRADDCRGLFGVDLGGTTREGLELAGELFGKARVFHASGRPLRTVHPKLYIFEQSGRATLYTGSANLTAGGLWSNFETGTLFELDLAEAADADLLEQVRSWYERCWADPNGSREVTTATLDALDADPSIQLPREGEVRKVLGADAWDQTSESKRAFPNPIKGLRPVPPAPANAGPESESELPETVHLPGLAREEIETPAREDDLRVLIAGVPRDRWKQVGFNRTVTERFFRVYVNGEVLWIQGVDQSGAVGPARQTTLVLPAGSNQNHRIELPEPDGRGDPKPEWAIVVVLERSFRTFRYMSLRPGDSGYGEVQAELAAREAFGAARKPQTKRVLLSYGELKAAWPGRCPLRP